MNSLLLTGRCRYGGTWLERASVRSEDSGSGGISARRNEKKTEDGFPVSEEKKIITHKGRSYRISGLFEWRLGREGVNTQVFY